MVPSLCESVARQARQHCAARGYVRGPNWNPLEPEVTRADDLPAVAGKRVLLIEDDLVTGTSLRLLVAALQPHGPAWVALYLGRRADSQFPENAPPPITSIYLAETHLNPAHRAEDEADFLRVFENDFTPTEAKPPSRPDGPIG
jgi:hypothetical protein